MKIKSNSYSAKALGPKDCLDLWRGGQNVPGYYPVVNDNKLRFVYCNIDGTVYVMIDCIEIKALFNIILLTRINLKPLIGLILKQIYLLSF